MRASKTAAESGRSDASHCSPQQHPHNAPHPALLLPVRSQSTHAADPPSSARNSGSFVPPEPTSQLASLWCDGAANHFLFFRSGAGTGVQEGFQTMREGTTHLEVGSRRPSSMPTCTDCPCSSAIRRCWPDHQRNDDAIIYRRRDAHRTRAPRTCPF